MTSRQVPVSLTAPSVNVFQNVIRFTKKKIEAETSKQEFGSRSAPQNQRQLRALPTRVACLVVNAFAVNYNRETHQFCCYHVFYAFLRFRSRRSIQPYRTAGSLYSGQIIIQRVITIFVRCMSSRYDYE